MQRISTAPALPVPGVTDLEMHIANTVLGLCKRQTDKSRSLDNLNIDCIVASAKSDWLASQRKRSPAKRRKITAKDLKDAMWIAFYDPQYNQRVVDTETTRDGQIKVQVDYGKGGEPVTRLFEANETVLILS